MAARLNGWGIELHLIKETTLESLVEVLHQICCGNKYAVNPFHLLKDNVLQRVLHLVCCPFGTFMAHANNSIGLVEKQYGS